MNRPRLLFSLLFLLVAPVALADADLSVELGLKDVPFHGRGVEVLLTLTNHGPDTATDIVVEWTAASSGPMITDDLRCKPAGHVLRCELPLLESRKSIRLHAIQPSRVNTGVYERIAGTVVTATPDPKVINNSDILTYLPVAPPADLRANVTLPPLFDPGEMLTIRYDITNQHPIYPAPLLARISIPNALAIVHTNAGCRVNGTNVECTLEIPPSTTFPLEITARFAEPTGTVTTGLELVWIGYGDQVVYRTSGGQIYPRRFAVTSTADDGPGSLRATIAEANALCVEQQTVPCVIDFKIAETVPAEGWFTIRPLTPLPDVTARNLGIDARTQTAFSGDTNPRGPEVFLDGSTLSTGNGFLLRGHGTAIHGFAISNFPDNAVFAGAAQIYADTYVLSGNYIGVDPTGTRAMPNLRGVMTAGGSLSLQGNVISGNTYSGVFLWETRNLDAAENRIGVAAATDDPIPNGSSGIFIRAANQGFFSLIEINRNVIAHNGHFGIAYTRSVWARVGANRIFSNSLGGVDIDLDGPTPSQTPRIDRAYWDGTATVIEGMLAPRTVGSISDSFAVHLYANTQLEPGGYAEGERFLGTANGDATGRFTFRYEGDLRGLYVNGMLILIRNHYGELTTSQTFEFGQAVAVTTP